MDNWFEKNRWFVFGTITVLAIAYSVWAITHPATDTSPVVIEIPTPVTPSPTPLPPTTTPTPTPAPLRVYISGEVRQPDVYILPPGSIIKDAISAAGGATSKANLDVVNQAQELKDQQHIHIPAHSDNLPTPPVVEGGVSQIKPVLQTTPSPTKVNINSASLQALELLPGIGPAIAQRIIDYRSEYGAFATPEDIMRVKGIGQGTFDKLKDMIVVE